MHAQVPQYLDVEDKIIGPFSLKQFLYLLFGGGVIFLLYNILKFPVFIIISLPIAIFVLALAFYKIGRQKFSQFVISFLGFISKPNIYTWKKLPPQKTEGAGLRLVTKQPTSPASGPPKPKEAELEEIQWGVELKK